MRKIRGLHIGIFFAMLSVSLILSIGVMSGIMYTLSWHALFVGVVLFLMTLYACAVVWYRILGVFFKIPEGEIAAGSFEETIYQVRTLFVIFFFDGLMMAHLLPSPLTRLWYRCHGASLGENSYPGGCFFASPYEAIEAGENVIFGYGSVLVPHILEHGKLGVERIVIGNNVTIGANAVVLPGARIGNGAIIAAGAVVTKRKQIGENEIWGGVPARCLGKVEEVVANNL